MSCYPVIERQLGGVVSKLGSLGVKVTAKILIIEIAPDFATLGNGMFLESLGVDGKKAGYLSLALGLALGIGGGKWQDEIADLAQQGKHADDILGNIDDFTPDKNTASLTNIATDAAEIDALKKVDATDAIKKVDVDDLTNAKRIESGSSSTYSGEEWYNYFADKYGKENVQGTFFNEIKYHPSTGVKLEPTEGITTTILGRYDMDTQAIFSETGNIKSISYDSHNGGFNLLNVPDELSYANDVDFWNDYNVPFLDEVIARKDIIQLATEPNQASMFRISTKTGKIERSGFGREILYLEEHGYKFDKTLMQMVPVD